MSMVYDVIVVGSGPSAAHAAQRLVGTGLRVLMVDVGNEDSRYAPLIPQLSFRELRHRDERQHRYFLGDDFEAVPLGRVRVGAQLTAPRAYIAHDTAEFTPLDSKSFFPTESLALGGLGSGWGAQAIQFNDRDLAPFPIGAEDLTPHYETVSKRIGISGDMDDLLPYYGDCSTLQTPLSIDTGVEALLARYKAKRSRLNSDGFFMGHPRLAVLSSDLGDRKAQQYHEMDFYSDADRSVYRPRFTVEALQKEPNFTYVRPFLVETFRESGEEIEVTAQNLRDVRAGGEGTTSFRARRLVLAAGAMGTARIVLRSLGLYETEIPLACNEHVYVPCINLPMLGRPASERRHSLTQAGIILDPGDRGIVYGEVHVYRSLLLFKLVKEAPIAVKESSRLLRDLMSAFVILVIEHEDYPTPDKYCVLRKGDGKPDSLYVSYKLEPEARRTQRAAETRLLKCVRSLACFPFKRIDPGHGASIHYGGTFPMTNDERELTTTPSGLLRGTRNVYLADGSVFPYLPAKPLTLSLMANADRVALGLAGQFG